MAIRMTIIRNAIDLLQEWADLHDTPCRFDHHGYCQEHYLEEGEDCIVARTKKFLEDI